MPDVLPLHLGALHPVEQALTLLLAFGPFVVLGIVIVLRRRAEDAQDARDEARASDEVPDQRDR
ncbi:hypothetical protein [Nocardioides sp.]|uniref:hypothetical protein n=1 Tax=Nocardioides sp. TaxID=35761 RepID=UPI00262F006B|nr:hypothetical protein [Nocardioides sp.]